jgi:hypothetical protein
VKTGEKAGYTCLFKQQQLLPSYNPASELYYNKTGSNNNSNSSDKLINNKIDSDNNNKKLCFIKQKRLFLLKDSLTFKKHKYHF